MAEIPSTLSQAPDVRMERTEDSINQRALKPLGANLEWLRMGPFERTEAGPPFAAPAHLP